jgi:hypothetical protein
LRSVLILILALATFAGAQTAPAPTLTAEEQALVDAAVNLYLQRRAAGDKALTDLGELFDFLKKESTRQDEAITALGTNTKQAITTANQAATSAAQAAAAANTSAELANDWLQFRSEQATANDALKTEIELLKAKLNTIAPAPARWVLAWKTPTATTWAKLEGATLPKGSKVLIAVVDPKLAPFTVATGAEQNGIKTVTFTIDALPAWPEAVAPYDFNSAGTQGATFAVAGIHAAKAVVSYVTGASDQVGTTFTVQ